MIDSFSSPQALSTPQSRESSADRTNFPKDRPQPQPNRDFAAMLSRGSQPIGAQAGADTMQAATLFVVNTPSQAYSVTTAIGDSAASFEALPLIGPVGSVPGGLKSASPQIIAGETALSRPAVPPAPASISAKHGNGIALSTPGNPAAQSPKTRSAAAISSSPTIPHHQPQAFGSHAIFGPKIDGASKAGGGAPVSAPPPIVSKAASFAAVVAALPQEVRVLIRGVTLGQSERDALAREIRAAFSEHGLGQRSVRIISGEGAS